ncbi:MAG: hypothetical protein ACI8W0_000595 [Flavobacterium sp.]|jgi:hypothetical protein
MILCCQSNVKEVRVMTILPLEYTAHTIAIVMPTNLAEEQIAEFKMLYKKHFEIELAN